MTDGDAPLIADLVDANHILVAQGVLDVFGHASVRSAEHPDRFLLSRNMAPALVEAEDIIEFGLDGESDDPRPSYLERYIHAAIYAARPDVNGIVHSHAPGVIPFTVSEQPLRPVMHLGGFLGLGVRKFDIRNGYGDATDLLISNLTMGEDLAQTMDAAPVVLMRGHGFVTVATSLRVAVLQAVYTQVNARVQQDALRLGEPVYLTDEEARAASTSNAGQIARAWGVWVRQANSATFRD